VINVENQLKNPDSLLWWMKRLIALRKRYQAFGRGNIEFLPSENRKVLSYVRQYKDETILAVVNLSHLAQPAQLDLSKFTGYCPVDLFGRVEFAPIADSKYYFTLSPHAFYWFSLESQPTELPRLHVATSEEARVVPTINETEENLFARKENRSILEAVLLGYIKGQRWFRGKAREALAAKILDIVPMRFNGSTAYFTLLQIEYSEGEPETYAVPLKTVLASREAEIKEKHTHAIIIRLKPRGKSGGDIVYDAMVDRDFGNDLLSSIKRQHIFKGIIGEIAASPTLVLSRITIPALKSLEPLPLKAEQSNTSIIYGDQLVFKLYRKMEDGINPEVEIGRFLTENTTFKNIPQVAGSLEYRSGRNKPISLGILQSFVPNEGDAWQYTLDALQRYFELVLAHPTVQAPPVPRKPLLSLPKELPPLARETIGAYMASAQLLGQRTAELHVALASAPEDPDFAPLPYTLVYQTSLYQSFRGFAMRTLEMLREQASNLPEESLRDAKKVLDKEKNIVERYNLIRQRKISASRIRCHGDYHLGQVLYTGKDFIITDFEGEPARPLSERNLKRSLLKDVAGMIRSFNYAAFTALIKQMRLHHKPENTTLKYWAQFWYTWVSVIFLNTYLDIIKPAGLLPEDPAQLKILLDAFLLDKALYEVGYELNNRPDWVKIPLQGILQILEEEG